MREGAGKNGSERGLLMEMWQPHPTKSTGPTTFWGSLKNFFPNVHVPLLGLLWWVQPGATSNQISALYPPAVFAKFGIFLA